MPNRRDEIKCRAEKASPGPWHADEHDGIKRVLGKFHHSCHKGASFCPNCHDCHDVIASRDGHFIQRGKEVDEADIDFIANSREDIDYLLRQVEQHEVMLDLLANWKGDIDSAKAFIEQSYRPSKKNGPSRLIRLLRSKNL